MVFLCYDWRSETFIFNLQGFGRADHSIAVEKLIKAYPDYESITFSNKGYKKHVEKSECIY